MFKIEDFYLLDNAPRTPYRQRKDEVKTTVHHGQRKLLITEMNFLTFFCDSKQNCNIVYAGAAPGIHIPILSSLFPDFTFYLYDPLPFKIKSTDKIIIYNREFTDDDAKYWQDKNIYFISDIRTADYTKMERLENEQQIIKDMRLQENWYKIIKPTKALLKFRLPYAYDDIAPKFKYLDGILMKQAWAPQTSTETRLIPNDKEKEWDILQYEQQMFHHNSVIREKNKYFNIFDSTTNAIDYPELLNDYDSLFEITTIMYYLRKYNKHATRSEIIKISHQISEKLGKKISDKRKYK